MKKVLVIGFTAMVLSFSAMSEEIVCKYMGGAYRPTSQLAKDIASELEINSCQGSRFKAVALQLNKTIKKEKASKAEKTAYLKSMDVGTKNFQGR